MQIYFGDKVILKEGEDITPEELHKRLSSALKSYRIRVAKMLKLK